MQINWKISWFTTQQGADCAHKAKTAQLLQQVLTTWVSRELKMKSKMLSFWAIKALQPPDRTQCTGLLAIYGKSDKTKKEREKKKDFGRRRKTQKGNGPFRRSGGRSIRTAMHLHVIQYYVDSNSKVILYSPYIKGSNPPDFFFFALFPSLYSPRGWNVLLQ